MMTVLAILVMVMTVTVVTMAMVFSYSVGKSDLFNSRPEHPKLPSPTMNTNLH